jgi:excisionase family DNA binding protein
MSAVLEKTNEKIYTVAEAAAELGMTEGRVRQLLLAGKMHGKKFGRTVWMIPESELAKFREPAGVGRPRSRLIRK